MTTSATNLLVSLKSIKKTHVIKLDQSNYFQRSHKFETIRNGIKKIKNITQT